MEIFSKITPWILYFFIYALAGYILEVVLCSIVQKRAVNRGFLFGPIIPIYGFGMIFVLLSTAPFRDDTWMTFLVTIVVCSVLEYATSWAMEKLFGIKWWDYSKSDRFNLNGRICVRNCLAFGIAGVMIVKYIQPFIEKSVNYLTPSAQTIAAIILISLFLLDTIASTYAVQKVKHSIKLKLISGDQTNEIKKLARRAIAQLVTRKNYLERRIDELQKEFEKHRREFEANQEKRYRELKKKFESYKK